MLNPSPHRLTQLPRPLGDISQVGKPQRIQDLLQNKISIRDLSQLSNEVDANDLSDIIQRIYDLNEKYILNISSVEGILRKLDDFKNAKRNKQFYQKIKAGFTDKSNPQRQGNKIILAEGDSWFNYPVILTDIIDRVAMEHNFAVYSLASGGDWLLNMLTGQRYVEELSVLHPQVFMISGGGNDLVGSNRLAAMLDSSGTSTADIDNPWVQGLLAGAAQIASAGHSIPLDNARFRDGVRFLSKDFFSLLMFFYLQYHSLIKGILGHGIRAGDKFYPIQIITQGYDYVIPSDIRWPRFKPQDWYVPFIRSFLGHGRWLKRPMQIRGLTNPDNQRNTMYAIIYLFNEMMIYTARYFNSIWPNAVSHIDSRNSVGDDGWTDELHAKPVHFIRTAETIIGCLNETLVPNYERVFVVSKPVKMYA